MRRSMAIGDVVACALDQRVGYRLPVFDSQLARNYENNMAFMAPMVGHVARAIDNKTELDRSNFARPNRCPTDAPGCTDSGILDQSVTPVGKSWRSMAVSIAHASKWLAALNLLRRRQLDETRFVSAERGQV